MSTESGELRNYYGHVYHNQAVEACHQNCLRHRLEPFQLSANEAMSRYEFTGEVLVLLVCCPCGRRYGYPTLDDLPAESVVCECGQPVITFSNPQGAVRVE